MELGERAKAARKARGWSLGDLAVVLADLDYGTINPGTLQNMEDGKRPGDTRVWGGIWKALGLPLRELYVGLGLPAPESEPGGTLGEILSAARSLNESGQSVLLMLAKHTPALVVAAGGTTQAVAEAKPAPVAVQEEIEETVEERERREYLEEWIGYLRAMRTDQLQERLVEFRAANAPGWKRLKSPSIAPAVTKNADA